MGELVAFNLNCTCGDCAKFENGCAVKDPGSPVADCNEFEPGGDKGVQVIEAEPFDICKDCKNQEYDCTPNEGDKCSWFEPCPDKVNHPSHYTQGGIECIEAIRASMLPAGFQDYCKGNVLKYVWRWRQKGGVEDLKKAQVYLNWLIESAEGKTDNGTEE